MSIYNELSRIQKELKAPKTQRNKFGNYNYRSCEDILESLKPILGKCAITISDDIVDISGRFYVKATAKLSLSADEFIENTAYARETEEKKGMDEAQITGASSSYARKYALNGLFAIDDTKDADATNTHEKVKLYGDEPPLHNKETFEQVLINVKEKLGATNSLDELENVWKSEYVQDNLKYLKKHGADTTCSSIINYLKTLKQSLGEAA